MKSDWRRMTQACLWTQARFPGRKGRCANYLRSITYNLAKGITPSGAENWLDDWNRWKEKDKLPISLICRSGFCLSICVVWLVIRLHTGRMTLHCAVTMALLLIHGAAWHLTCVWVISDELLIVHKPQIILCRGRNILAGALWSKMAPHGCKLLVATTKNSLIIHPRL